MSANQSGEYRTPEFSDADIENAVEQGLSKSPEDQSQSAAEKQPQPAEFLKAKVGETANRFAGEAIGLIKAGKGKGREALTTLKGRFLEAAKQSVPDINEADAIKQLREYLQSQHDAQFSLGNAELASEIDSFGRSLEASEEVQTQSGLAFMHKLESGGFTNMEAAMTALDEIKDKEKGVAGEQLNAEFNLLYKAANEFFEYEQGNQKQEGGLEFGDSDIDNMFGDVAPGQSAEQKPDAAKKSELFGDDDIDNMLGGLDKAA